MTTALKLFRNFKAVTPHGTFTRGSATPYSFIVVRSSPRAQAFFQKVQAGDEDAIRQSKNGVHARWCKDMGWAVTFHATEQSAKNSAAYAYTWDAEASALGIYPVEDQPTTASPSARPRKQRKPAEVEAPPPVATNDDSDT